MRFLSDSDSIRQRLRSNGRRWKIVHFFFDFRAGKGDANHSRGVLKPFLQQLTRMDELVAKFVLKPENDRVIKESPLDVHIWIDLLTSALRSTSTEVCAFVDGLDEYEGSLGELWSHLDIIRDRTGMKLCLASRPEPELKQYFKHWPSIAMQDHNSLSIQYYMDKKLEQHNLVDPRSVELFTSDLLAAIKTKAQGVILWARLVVDEMLKECDASTTEQTLRVLLDTIPPELEQLYERLLEMIAEQHKADAAWVLHLVTHQPSDVTTDILFQAIAFSQDNAGSFLGDRLDQPIIEFRITTVLGNMLDILKHQNRGGYEFDPSFGVFIRGDEITQTVRLVHFSLASYLAKSKWIYIHLATSLKRYEVHPWFCLKCDMVTRVDRDNILDMPTTTRNWLGLKLNTQSTDRRDFNTTDWIILKDDRWNSRLPFLRYCILQLPVVDEILLRTTDPNYTNMMESVFKSNTLTFHLCNWCMKAKSDSRCLERMDVLQCSGNGDLVFALLHGFLPYVQQYVDKRCVTAKSSQMLFDLSLSPRLHFSMVSVMADYKCLMLAFAQCGFHIQGRHICWYDGGYLSMFHSDTIPRLKSAFAARSGPWNRNHEDSCEFRNSEINLLEHWATMDFWNKECCFEMLRLMVDAGTDLTTECADGRDVFHAIVTSSAPNDRYNPNFWILGFLKIWALANAGGVPVWHTIRTDALKSVWLFRQRTKLGRSSQELQRNLDITTAVLSHFKQNRTWPDFNAIADENDLHGRE